MGLGNARRTRIRVGDSILYGLLDPVFVLTAEGLEDGEHGDYGYFEFYLEGNGSIIQLPYTSRDGNIGWTETT